MKRLTYSPKVYIFIRSENLGGKIFDVSSDVVSGSVTRKVSDVSTANFVLRNRFKKWIKDPVTQRQIFLPMDMVTIWLQRIAGRPIQVFTGYLDSVPFYQMYPNNCQFTATCTLKRLAYQWFDPGLEWFMNFIDKTPGWQYNVGSGDAFNTIGFGTSATSKTKLTDAGFGDLLYRFLLEVCGWKPENVWISNLDPNLPKRAAKLWNQVNVAAEQDLAALHQMLAQAMGISVQPVNGANPDGTLTHGTRSTLKQINSETSKAGVPLLVAVIAALALTALDPAYSHDSLDGDQFGYGLYAMRPKQTGSLPGISPHDGTGSNGTAIYADTIYGVPIKQFASADKATEVLCKRLNTTLAQVAAPASTPGNRVSQPEKAFRNKAAGGDAETVALWVGAAIGRTLDISMFDANVLGLAKQYVGALHGEPVVQSSTTPQSDYIHLNWDSPEITNSASPHGVEPDELKILRDNYKGQGALAELVPYIFFAKDTSKSIKLTYTGNHQSREEVYFTGPATAIRRMYNGLVGHSEYDWAIAKYQTDSGTVTTVLHAGQKADSAPPAQRQPSTNGIMIRVKKGAPYPTWDGQQQVPIKQKSNPDPTNGGSKIPDGATWEQVLSLSAASAFASQFAFPADYFASHALMGDKELMNVVSALDGVKQFCQASMRQFMSLPDGKFLAFYPDLFGYRRGPYWWISDLEIIDMGIQLNDEKLATHVFVTGDVLTIDGQIDVQDQIASRGVATITMASMLDSFIGGVNIGSNSAADSVKARLKDSWEFLQHYGARPYKEEAPLVRNVFYEFLLAWQRFQELWASQFNTSVTFTFQPEVMAGGIIGFPAHDLQMYVQEVTHTFDYGQGFDTQAVLSSPVAINRKKAGALHGLALSGTINTVGSIGEG